MPCCTMPRRVVPCHITPFCAVSHCPVPCHVWVCHGVMCHGVMCRAHQTPSLSPQVTLTAEESPPLSLANLAGTRTVGEGTRFSSPRELLFTAFHTLPRDVYYWVLPAPFAGDKVPAALGTPGGQTIRPQAWLSLTKSHPAGDIVRRRAAVHGDAPGAGERPSAAAPARRAAAGQRHPPGALLRHQPPRRRPHRGHRALPRGEERRGCPPPRGGVGDTVSPTGCGRSVPGAGRTGATPPASIS